MHPSRQNSKLLEVSSYSYQIKKCHHQKIFEVSSRDEKGLMDNDTYTEEKESSVLNADCFIFPINF